MNGEAEKSGKVVHIATRMAARDPKNPGRFGYVVPPSAPLPPPVNQTAETLRLRKKNHRALKGVADTNMGALRELTRQLMGRRQPLKDHEWDDLRKDFFRNAEANPVLWRSSRNANQGVTTSLLELPELASNTWLCPFYVILAQQSQSRQFLAVTNAGGEVQARPITFEDINGKPNFTSRPLKIRLFEKTPVGFRVLPYDKPIDVSQESARDLAAKGRMPVSSLDF